MRHNSRKHRTVHAYPKHTACESRAWARRHLCGPRQVVECAEACARGMARGWTWTNDFACDECRDADSVGGSAGGRVARELQFREVEPTTEREAEAHAERVKAELGRASEYSQTAWAQARRGSRETHGRAGRTEAEAGAVEWNNGRSVTACRSAFLDGTVCFAVLVVLERDGAGGRTTLWRVSRISSIRSCFLSRWVGATAGW